MQPKMLQAVEAPVVVDPQVQAWPRAQTIRGTECPAIPGGPWGLQSFLERVGQKELMAEAQAMKPKPPS